MQKSFLKWAGGKNWFINNHYDKLPINYNTYIEPFLGGGSVFFRMEPERSILSDTNRELILTYKAIRNKRIKLYETLKIHSENHSREYYYQMRESVFTRSVDIAARFIYLNRTCFNGLYRVNKDNKFNVPIGTHNNVLHETDMFKERAKLLKKAKLFVCDFETTINLSSEGDFLFCDPPYTVQHNSNGFVSYNEKLFSWEDQIRLSQALIRAKDRGVQIILTNANHESVRNLYINEGFLLEPVSRYSSVSGKKESRTQYEELIISANIQRGVMR